MKKFTFKYTKTIWSLIAILLIISLIGTGTGIFNLVTLWDLGAKNIVTYSILTVVNLLLLAFCVCLIFFKSYTIDDERLSTRFGMLKFKVKLSDVTEVTIFEKQQKLVVYFSGGKYTVIVIDEKEFDDFCDALKEKNPSIYVSKKSQD